MSGALAQTDKISGLVDDFKQILPFPIPLTRLLGPYWEGAVEIMKDVTTVLTPRLWLCNRLSCRNQLSEIAMQRLYGDKNEVKAYLMGTACRVAAYLNN